MTEKEYKDELIQEIRLLREKVCLLEKEIHNTNNTLVNHIEFINNVYESIKRPLTYIMNKVNNVFLLDNKENDS